MRISNTKTEASCRGLWLLSLAGILSAGFISCTTYQPPDDKDLNRTSKQLERLDDYANEWGRASVSDIALIDNTPAPGVSNGFFALQYTNPTGFYMNQARQNVQGTATVQVQSQTGFSFAGSVVPPLGGGATASLPAALAIATNTTSTISPSTNAAASTNSAAKTPATTVPPAVPTNASLQPLVTYTSNTAPELSESVVLKIGATDKITERILNYMSDPFRLPNNKRAYLGVMQISALPGWRTKKGYICEVQASFHFAKSRDGYMKENAACGKSSMFLPEYIDANTAAAERIGLPEKSSPSIVSAFPYAESQILDLTSSLQRQISFLAQLAGSLPQFPALQASLKTTFQKLTQQNLNTRSALPQVVPSSQGSDVTYRFDPELQALADPASSSGKAGHILEPISFPALIVMICEEKDLKEWDTVRVDVETRWIPETDRHWFKSSLVDWWLYGYKAPDRKFADEVRLGNARTFDEIETRVKHLTDSASERDSFTTQEIVRRFENLKPAAMGHTLYSALPPVKPHVIAVFPPSFRQDDVPPTLRVLGGYFKSPFAKLKYIGLDGLELANCKVESDLITAKLDAKTFAGRAPGSYNLKLVTDAGETTWTEAITVLPVPAPILTSVIGRPLRESPDTRAVKPQALNITGQHFSVNDHSLAISIGGVPLNLSKAIVTDRMISVNVNTSSLGLPPGKYDLTVITIGGQAVLSQAVEVDYKATSPEEDQFPPILASVNSVFPDEFRVDDPPKMLIITGDYLKGKTQKIEHVRMGTIELHIAINDTKSVVVDFPKNRFPATNYSLELFNHAGKAVLSNCPVQILPVPTPILGQSLPVKINSTGAAPVKLTVYGQNFDVKDGSLHSQLGNEWIDPDPGHTDTKLVYTVSAANAKAGANNLTISTSGGKVVLTNAVTIVNSADHTSLTINSVEPKHGYLFTESSFLITGANFDSSGRHSAVKTVLIGGRSCDFKVLSASNIVARVPAWAHFDSTNDLIMATNKFDVAVASTSDSAVATDAVYFDLALPNDANRSLPLAPDALRAHKVLDALNYVAQLLNTNLSITPSFSLKTAVGTNTDKAEKDSPSFKISADVNFGTNKTNPSAK